jgi:hypothetical protein
MGLKVRVDGDGSGFSATLDKLAKDAANFGNTLSSKVSGNFSQAIMGIVPGLTSAIAGIFSAEAVKTAVTKFYESGQTIKFGAAKMNVDTETFQQIDRVMKEVGSSADALDPIIEKIAVSLTHIKEGASDAGKLREGFAQAGIAGDDLDKSAQEVLFKIVELNKGLQLTNEQITAMRQFGGRGVDQLFPAMAMGGFTSDFAKAGVLDKQTLANLDDLHQKMLVLEATTDRWYNKVAGRLASGWKPVMVMASYLMPGLEGLELRNRFAGDAAAQAAAREAADKKADEHKIEIQKAMAQAVQDQQKADEAKALAADRKKAETINKETAALEERSRLAALPPDERKLELEKQINDLVRERQEFMGELSESEDAALRKKIAEAKAELGRLEKTKPDHERYIMERLGNAAIGGIMLSHGGDDPRQHRARVEKHLESIDRKTCPPAPGAANKDYP